MLSFIIESIIWILCVYGLLSIIRDIIEENANINVKDNIKLILAVKDVENGIEDYIRRLRFSKNFCTNLVVIDLDSNDDTKRIVSKLEEEGIDIKLLEKENGREYLEKIIAS